MAQLANLCLIKIDWQWPVKCQKAYNFYRKKQRILFY